jgi:GH25 family lysozyme M1 (1,4-beta-N-acetylmuramidase)
MPIPGLDLSYYQIPANVPLAAWKAAGLVRFVYARASIGFVADIDYFRHRANARAAGLPFGSYHFLLRHNPPSDSDTRPPFQFDPVLQARNFVSLLDGNDALPPVVDVEASDIDDAELWAFLQEFWRLCPGRRIIIYASQSSWYALIGRGKTRYIHPLILWWIADYSGPLDLPDVCPRATLHQKTGTGRLPGYDRNLDLDEFEGDEDAFALFITEDKPMPVTLTDDQAKQVAGFLDTLLERLTLLKAQSTGNAVWAQGEMDGIFVVRPLLVIGAPPPPVKHTLSLMTNNQVFTLFQKAFGPTYFTVVTRACDETFMLAHRTDLYVGVAIEDMPTLTDAERSALINGLGLPVG